ncbi:chromosome segregation protein [Bacillus sp. 165]|uniref:chromosome segregation protein n=1 Tax=Bacillus sp. 165 TaxID=1529117 RepID=UPI001ADA5464|nr:chromosome segregation protein [Bacillus sp. 165]MBO9129318.1 chromosome segregation protein [Bacillus sp. 165]
MEYKTPMVAQKLGVSSKVILRIVQQLDLNLQKNKFGHYLFSQKDIDQILAYHEVSQGITESAATESIADEEEIEAPPVHKSPDTELLFQQQLEELSRRVDRNEESIGEKASDIVAYQVLQHRNEIEELMGQIKELTERISVLERRKNNVHDLPSAYKIEKPKRKRMLLSIFGL